MNITSRLKVMFFLQYFIWGSWLVTLGSYMINTLGFSGTDVGLVYSSKGIAAIIMPAIIGIIADKWLRPERLYLLCHLVSAASLLAISTVTNSHTMFWVMLINAMAYVPTIALSNSIAYSCLAQVGKDPVSAFPPIRVFGTVGFIVAMWTVSLLGLETNRAQLYISASASILLALYTFVLPKITTAQKTAAVSWVSKLGLNAFVLFKNPQILIFFVFATLLGAVLQITNVFGNPFLHDFARHPEFADSLIVTHPSLLLSVSQMAEVGFILTIPYFFKRFGIKTVMLISMIAWTLRFGLFAFGDPSPFGTVLLLTSMIVYGCAFDFFNISGSVFVEKAVSPDIRSSAQGLFMTMVNGVGAWVGSMLSGVVIDYFSVDNVKNWHAIWLVFASYTLVLAIVFVFSFHYKQPSAQTAHK